MGTRLQRTALAVLVCTLLEVCITDPRLSAAPACWEGGCPAGPACQGPTPPAHEGPLCPACQGEATEQLCVCVPLSWAAPSGIRSSS